MEAMFIRHNLKASNEVLEDFWSKRLVAVHFDNIASTSPDEYKQPAGRKALKKLWKFCDDGAIVGAEYPIREASLLVGVIEPKSKVEVRKYGEKFYKVVQLKRAREVHYRDYPLLMIKPIQTTLAKWNIGHKILLSILSGENIPWTVDSLHPSQLEVLCYEYLRMKGMIAGLLMPIGRTLQDVDIWGVSKDGGEVLAQVTHSTSSTEIGEKVRKLKNLETRSPTLFFFGPKSQEPEFEGIKFISIEIVFDEMTSNKSTIQYEIVARMLGRLKD